MSRNQSSPPVDVEAIRARAQRTVRYLPDAMLEGTNFVSAERFILESHADLFTLLAEIDRLRALSSTSDTRAPAPAEDCTCLPLPEPTTTGCPVHDPNGEA